MKNTIKLFCILLSLLLLCSCSAEPAAPTESTKAPAATDTPAETEPVDGGWAAEDDYIFPLFEDETFRLELLIHKTTQGKTRCDLRVVSLVEEPFTVYCTDILLNGCISVEEIDFYSVEDQHTQIVDTYALLGQPVQSFSCKVEKSDYTSDSDTAHECSVTIPSDFVPHLICEPKFNAKAVRQTLCDTDQIKLTLLAAGDLMSDNGYSSPFSIAMLAENKTDKALPLNVPSAAVNGSVVDVYGIKTDLAAKQQLFCYCDISTYSLGDSLEEIWDLSLQIMTDQSENTGMAFSADGGSWYPVKLQQSGTEAAVEIREVLYEDDTLQIGLIGLTSIDYSFDDESCHKWELSILNKSDQNLTLSSFDEAADGEIIDDVAGLYGDLGAGLRLHTDMWVHTKPDAPVPAVSFCLRVTTQGAGALLYNINTPIVLPTE